MKSILDLLQSSPCAFEEFPYAARFHDRDRIECSLESLSASFRMASTGSSRSAQSYPISCMQTKTRDWCRHGKAGAKQYCKDDAEETHCWLIVMCKIWKAISD